MSDVSGGITKPNKNGKKLHKILIEGKIPDDKWEAFKACLKQCVDQHPNLTIKFIDP
jgi:hypothetical protein